MSGSYSTTPLERKLGIKEGFTILLYHPPMDYLGLFTQLPGGLQFMETGPPLSVDLAHLFCMKSTEVEAIVPKAMTSLKRNGSLWLSWPKKTSKIDTELSRDPIRERLLQMGLVDIKVASIDSDWSGLKFVYPLKDR
jgi:hypothetical protein